MQRPNSPNQFQENQIFKAKKYVFNPKIDPQQKSLY